MTDEEREVLFKKFDRDVEKYSRWFRLTLAIDQFFAVLIWNASQDETICSYIGRKIERGEDNWFDRTICRMLNVFQSRHCKRARGE